MPATQQQSNTVAASTDKIDVIVATLNHRQRAALVAKYEALKKPIREDMAKRFPKLTKLEQYIADKLVSEANGKITSESMPGWRATLAAWAPSLDSEIEPTRKAAEERLDTLRTELESADAVRDVLKWYKVKTDATSKDAHIVKVCSFFGIDPTLIA